MPSTPMVTISRFSRTFMRWNGISAARAELDLEAGHAGDRLEMRDQRAIAAGEPATVPLMPSAAMQQRSLDARPQQ